MNHVLWGTVFWAAFLSGAMAARAEILPHEAAAYFDFQEGVVDRAPDGRALRLRGAKLSTEGRLEFTGPLQWAEMDEAAMANLAQRLDGIKAMSVGGWFFCRRSGEQQFFFRALPEIAPLGERMFRPRPDEIDFCLGTDQHGFFLATVHGNGLMPFPLVTLNDVRIHTWCQLVAVKDEQGLQKFYQNGTLLHTDGDSAWSGKVWPFREHGLHWAMPKDARSSQSLPGMRPYLLDPDLPLPATFYEFTALIAPRPLWVGQAVGERRPTEEENYAAVAQVYRTLGCDERVSYVWYPGDHDFPPAARQAAAEWFRRWLDPTSTDP